MKNWLIRLQVFTILLIFASPIIFLLIKNFEPQISLAKYDRTRLELEKTYPILSPLHSSGKFIMNSNNEPVILRGVNIASTTWGPEYEIWNPNAVEYSIKNWNANVIRTRVHQYEFTENPAKFFLKLEQQILAPARANGAYVILHPWFGENQSIPDKEGEYMWLSIAKRYKNDPHIIYDIFAEPRDIGREELFSAYNSLIPKLRAVAPSSLIMVTGLDWGREINSFIDAPLPYNNLVYRTNPYNKVGEFEGLFGRIAEIYPVFIGEFGTDDKLTMKQDDVESLLGYATSLNLGWTAWHFSSSGCPCLLTDNDTFAPSPYGQLVFDALNGNNPDYLVPTFSSDPQRYYIYSDFLDHGFTDYSWLTSTSLQTTPALVDKYSFSSTLRSASGIYFHTSLPVNPSDYQSLVFIIKTDEPSTLSLRFRDTQDKFSPVYPLTDYLVGNTVTIPLSNLNLSDISGVSIEPSTELVSPLSITLDEMYFTK